MWIFYFPTCISSCNQLSEFEELILKTKIKRILKKHKLLYEVTLTIRDYLNLQLNHINSHKIRKATPEKLKEMDAQLFQKRKGETLDWNHLESYTEKMQWEKLFDKDPRKSLLSDKYKVRDWVTEKIGDEYLIPLLGVYDSLKEIDFKELPNQFVIKTNHGSGDAVIVRDKKNLKVYQKLNLWRKINISLQKDYGSNYLELHYSDIEPKILIESFMQSGDGDLQDYKFLCFNGIPYYCWVDVDRFSNHKRNVYDLNWNLQNWNQYTYGNADNEIPKPQNFSKMIEIARKLSEGFGHVRVDLYNINGKIYFSEMTFTNGSGFEPIVPKSMDYELGKLWNINSMI